MGAKSEFVFYKQSLGHNSFRLLRGRRGTRPGYYFPFLEKNRFADHEVRVPANAKRRKSPNAEWIRDYMYNPLQHRVQRIHKPQHDDDDVFEIHDNGGRPFIAYVSRNDDEPKDAVIRNHPRRVCVYRVPEDVYTWEEDWKGGDDNHDLYSQLVLQLDHPQKVFIGVDIADPQRNGNSMLVQTGAHTYVSIGWNIYSFTARDTIRTYYSNVGNSDVPYPVAIGENNLYLTIEDVVVPIVVLFPRGTPHDDVLSDAYQQFYDMFDRAHVKPPANYTIDNIRILQKRLW